MDDPWIRLHQGNEDRSKFGVPPSELGGYGGEDELQVSSVLKVPRTEEGSTKMPIREHPLRNCLSDGALPRPCEPIQPVDRGFMKVACPEFNLVQNGYMGPLETTGAVAMSVLGLLRKAEVI